MAASAAVLAAPFVPLANAAPGAVHATFNVPYKITTSVTPDSYCDNTGPHITFGSILELDGHTAQVTLTQNVNHSVQVVGSLALTLWNANDPTAPPQIAKQPPLGGVGGNPYLYFLDDTSGDINYLGRCVQDFGPGQNNGKGPWKHSGNLGGFADLTVQSLICDNKGSSLQLGTSSGVGDATGHLLLTNQFRGLDSVHLNKNDILASVGFTLASTPLKKGGGKFSGAGGNPNVSVETGTGLDPFVGDGNGIGLGRCNKLN